jgi:hypothetical protein
MTSPHGSAARLDDEPKTPLWLPALGLVFFVALAIVWATLPAASQGPQAASPSSASPGASVALPLGHP